MDPRRIALISFFAFVYVAACRAVHPAPAPDEAISIKPVEVRTDAGPVRGYVATVDLASPRVEVVVTGPTRWSDDEGRPIEAVLEPTDGWARRLDVVFAMNANFYNESADKRTADIVGLAVSDGQVVSPARTYAGVDDPSLLILHDRRAILGPANDAGQVRHAVSGVGASDGAPDLGGPLIRDGQNVAAHARVVPLERHPRTAIGVDQTGRRLIAVVIDGRQPGWSVGVTLPELADLMLAHGAHNAINLDGGGSSSFVYRAHPDQPAVTNRPSDGYFRPVANHLGVRLRPAPSPDPKQPPTPR